MSAVSCPAPLHRLAVLIQNIEPWLGHGAHRDYDPGGWKRMMVDESKLGGQRNMGFAAVCLGDDTDAQLAVNHIDRFEPIA